MAWRKPRAAQAVMVGDYHRGEVEFSSRYGEDSCMGLVEALETLQRVQPPRLTRLSRDCARSFLHDYEEYESQVEHIARSGIPVVPSTSQGLIDVNGLRVL